MWNLRTSWWAQEVKWNYATLVLVDRYIIMVYFQTRIWRIVLEYTCILTTNFILLINCSFLLIQLVNSIATTYVGTHAYMAVRFKYFILPCNQDAPNLVSHITHTFRHIWLFNLLGVCHLSSKLNWDATCLIRIVQAFKPLELPSSWRIWPEVINLTIGSMLPCVCSIIDHRWCPNVIRTKKGAHIEIADCVSDHGYHILTFLWCIWNLFVSYNKEIKTSVNDVSYWSVPLLITSKNQPKGKKNLTS